MLVYLITLLLFNISKNQIQYPDISAEKYVKNILVIIFTGINSIAILPYIAKMYNKIYEGTIEAQELKKKTSVYYNTNNIRNIFRMWIYERYSTRNIKYS